MKAAVVFLSLLATAHGFAMLPSIPAFSRVAPMAEQCRLRLTSARNPALRGIGRTVAMATPAVDTPAPGFDLPSDSGTNLSLKSLRGKWVVVYFYPKAFTAGCTCQAEAYQQDIAQFRSQNCEVVGISTNPIEKIQEFKQAYGLSFPMLSDREGTVVEAYGAAIKLPFIGTFANRFTFIVDPNGVLKASFGNPDPKMDSIVSFARLMELQNPK